MELTKEQDAQFPVYQDRAIKFALYSGDEIDVPAFEEGIDFLYSLIDLTPPRKMIVDSPYAMQVEVNKILTPNDWQFHTPGFVGIGANIGWVTEDKMLTDFGKIDNPNFNKFAKFIESGVWDTFLFDELAIGCRRPSFVARNDDGQLSNDQGPAIKWRDGVEFYFLDGQAIEEDLYPKIVSGNMQLEDIMAIPNADVQTIALKYNPETILQSGAKLIHKSERGNELFLLEGTPINTMLATTREYFVRMKCPTGRVFIEGIEAKFADKWPDADRCQAYNSRMTYEQYQALSREA